MRAEDAASGPSEHASQTHLRSAVRQLSTQDRYAGQAHGARPHASLKSLPPTPMAALSSTRILCGTSVTPWDRRFGP